MTAEGRRLPQRRSRHVPRGQATPSDVACAPGKQFPTHRPGYVKEEVDAFLDKAEPMLAAMRATDKRAP
jgi:DivIVA domain-containing protein